MSLNFVGILEHTEEGDFLQLESPEKSFFLETPQIAQFDVDNTLIMWDLSKYKDLPTVTISTKMGDAVVVPNQKNINLLIKLAKSGYWVQVYSGSGPEWALKVCEAIGVRKYVKMWSHRPKVLVDDKPADDAILYQVYRDPLTGEEI